MAKSSKNKRKLKATDPGAILPSGIADISEESFQVDDGPQFVQLHIEALLKYAEKSGWRYTAYFLEKALESIEHLDKPN